MAGIESDSLGSKSGSVTGLWNRYFIIIALVSFLSSVCNQFFNTTSVLYTDSLGGNATYGGLMLAAFPISATIARIFAGRLCDLKGRIVLVVWGSALFAAASLAFEFFPYFGALVLLRFLQGIGFSIAGTAIAVVVTDVIPHERYGEGISYYGLVTSLTSAVAPATAMWLISGGDFSPIFYISSLCITVGIGLSLMCNYEKKLPKSIQNEPKNVQIENENQVSHCKIRNLLNMYFDRTAIPSALIQLVSTTASCCTLGFLMVYAKKFNIENAALYFTLQVIAIIASRLFTGKIVDKFGPMPVLVPGFIFGAVSFVLLALSAQHHLLFFLSAIINGLYSGLTYPALNAWAVKNTPAHRRSAAMSTYLVSIDIGVGLAGIIWGSLIDVMGFITVYYIVAILLAGTLAMSVAFFGKTFKPGMFKKSVNQAE